MRQLFAVAADLAIKYVAVAVAMAVVLTWVGNSPLGLVLYTAIWVMLVAYLFGDLLVYRYAGNAWAVVADFVLATFAIWVFEQMILPRIPLWQAFAAGAAVAAVEFGYHAYLGRRGYRAGAYRRGG
jgi:hypothetical protein